MSELKQFAEIMESMKAYIDHVEKEAYKRGLEEGKARNENGCVGCRYDDGTTEHSPCDYCCNAYSNQWSAKPCSDEIKVGDEVIPIDAIRRPFVVVSIENNVINGFDLANGYTPRGCHRDETHWEKTGRHFPQVAELLKAMKGEQQEPACITCRNRNALYCDACVNGSQWEPKEVTE